MTGKLEQELAKLKQGDHICSFYETRGEQLGVAVPFIVDGLARGERCIYIVDDSTFEEVVGALAAAGVDVVHERQRDALRLLTRPEACFRAGELVPQAMIEFIRQAETDALADGFSGLRQMGEMTWVLGLEPGCDRLIEFEAQVNHLLANSKIVGLCQYNRSRFETPCIHDIFRTHPLVILGDRVCHNPYYESPEMVLCEEQAVTTPEFKAKRVDWWIAQLKRAQADEQERASALEKLKESERRLAEAQRIAHIGSWERDLRTNQVNWSDELYRLFGLAPHEGNISYQRFLGLVSPQDADRIRALVDAAIRERSPFSFDYRITRPDGSLHVLNDLGAVILNQQGEPIRLVGTAQDVTELRQAEQAQQELKRQKEVLQTIFDNIPVMIVFVDPAGRLQLVNRHFEKVLGWSWEEVRNLDMLTELYPDRQYRQWVLEYIRAGNPGWCDFRTRVRDGRTLDTAWANVLLSDGTSIGIGQDVTERKHAEMALRQSEERLSLAVHAADLGIFEHDHQTGHLYWSPTMRAIFGVVAEEAVSMPAFLGLIHPEDRKRIVTAIAQAHAGRDDGLYRVEHRLVRPDSGVHWVNICARTLFEGAGDARRPLRTVGIVADITERKRAEEEIRDNSQSIQALSRRLLEVQEQERRHLSRELHDEFGQVLTAISLHLQAARRLAGDAARPRLDECATMLHQAQEHVRSLALELRPAMLDTLGVEATLRWLGKQHQERTGCEVQVVGHLSGKPLSPEMSIVCFRVVQEALTNIVRHAAARHVWIELTRSKSVLELIVRDDGVGFDMIPTQQQAARRGSLGIRGMRERVEILGGILHVESEPGRGTRIRASFSLREA